MFFCEIAWQVKRLPARAAGKLKWQELDIFQIAVLAQRLCDGSLGRQIRACARTA